MQFEGAVIKEQGVTFAIVIVKQSILNNRSEADSLIQSFQQQVFQGMPVILMAQGIRGRPTYYGRQDISTFMAKVPLNAIPWKRYTIT